MALHRLRELGSVVLLYPQKPEGVLVEPGVPGPERGARKSNHRAAEPEPGSESAARSHPPHDGELGGRRAAARIVR